MHVQGGRVSNPTYASPTLHTAPLPQIPFILTLIQDCIQGLTLSHLLHLRQTTTSHTSSCHSHRIAHAEPERVEHRSPQRQTEHPPGWKSTGTATVSHQDQPPRSPRRNLAIGPRQTGRRGRNFPSGRQNECTRSWARSLRHALRDLSDLAARRSKGYKNPCKKSHEKSRPKIKQK